MGKVLKVIAVFLILAGAAWSGLLGVSLIYAAESDETGVGADRQMSCPPMSEFHGSFGVPPTTEKHIYDEKVLFTARWGQGPNQYGIFHGVEMETMGPETFTVGRNGDIYILDSRAEPVNIKRYDKRGVFKDSIPRDGDPTFVVADNGHIINTGLCTFDLYKRCVHELSSSGELIGEHALPNALNEGGSLSINESGTVYLEVRQTYYSIGRMFEDGFKSWPEKMVMDGARTGFLHINRDYRLVINNRFRRIEMVRHRMAKPIYAENLTDKGIMTKRKDVKYVKEVAIVINSIENRSHSSGMIFLHQDKFGYIYVLTYRGQYLDVWKFDEEGNVVANVELPNQYYTMREMKKLEVDDDGNIYQLLTLPEGIKFSKWEPRGAMPDVVADPTSIHMGVVEPGKTSEGKVIMFSSVGDGDLVVTDLYLIGPDADMFNVEVSPYKRCPCPPFKLDPLNIHSRPPGCTFMVTFAPTSSGEKSVALRMITNDPDTPELNVEISGIGMYPLKDVETDSWYW